MLFFTGSLLSTSANPKTSQILAGKRPLFSCYLLAVFNLKDLFPYMYKMALFFQSPPLWLLQYLFVSGLQGFSKTNDGFTVLLLRKCCLLNVEAKTTEGNIALSKTSSPASLPTNLLSYCGRKICHPASLLIYFMKILLFLLCTWCWNCKRFFCNSLLVFMSIFRRLFYNLKV